MTPGSKCMPGSREYCPYGHMGTHSRTITLSFYGILVRHEILRDVTRHFNWPFGTLTNFLYEFGVNDPGGGICNECSAQLRWSYTLNFTVLQINSTLL